MRKFKYFLANLTQLFIENLLVQYVSSIKGTG